jgi:hypothetical protein
MLAVEVAMLGLALHTARSPDSRPYETPHDTRAYPASAEPDRIVLT